MTRYKIVVAYDGTDYCGWQLQPVDPSIVGELQKSFKRAFYKEISLVGASRTDTGVHALGQVASFTTDVPVEAETLRKVWQRQLHEAINLRSIEVVDAHFHPQRCVKQKTYYYHIFVDRPLPMVARYGWYCDFPLDIDKLQQSLAVFVGMHDFRSFCTGYDREDTVRTIDTIQLCYVPNLRAYRIVVKGKSFLRYMIRRIVGAAVLIASTQRSIDVLRKALAEKNPQQQLFTAPARGLVLRRIVYEERKGL